MQVTYNSYSIPNIFGKITTSENVKAFTFACNFLVTAASSSALVAACNTARVALTEKYKNLQIVFDSTTEINISHSGNTGFLAIPTLVEINNDLQTETARPYRFSVEVGLPFDQSGFGYRREGSFSIDYSPSRARSVTFSALYTAGGSNSALENYTANGKVWAATILTAIGGDYNLVSENISEEHEQKILNARLVYREILADESTSGRNDSAIVNPSCDISVHYGQEIGYTVSPGYQIYPGVIVNLSYSATIDKEVVTDMDNVEDVYQARVKPWLIAHAYGLLGLGNYSQAGTTNYIVQDERKSINPYSYTITGFLSFMAPRSADAIIELSEVITDTTNMGIVNEKIWNEQDFQQAVWGIGKWRTLTRVLSVKKLLGPPQIPEPYTDGSGGIFHLVSIDMRKSIRKAGVGTSGTSLRAAYIYYVTYIEDYIFVLPAMIPNQGNIE